MSVLLIITFQVYLHFIFVTSCFSLLLVHMYQSSSYSTYASRSRISSLFWIEFFHLFLATKSGAVVGSSLREGAQWRCHAGCQIFRTEIPKNRWGKILIKSVGKYKNLRPGRFWMFVCVTHYRTAMTFGKRKNILEDLFSSVLSQFKMYQPSGNLKSYNLGIFQSSKLRMPSLERNSFNFS